MALLEDDTAPVRDKTHEKLRIALLYGRFSRLLHKHPLCRLQYGFIASTSTTYRKQHLAHSNRGKIPLCIRLEKP